MAGVRRFVEKNKLGVAAATVGLVVIGGVAVAAGPDDRATVTAIVDGDTIDVQLDDQEHRVRLLNIDTPELGECLADEATAFLAERIPPGTQIDLEYDEDRYDQYDRLLAGVLEDGSLVNAEIAAQGLGIAVLFEPNARFYDDVLEAQESAEDAAIGLWSDEIECTLPAQTRVYGEQVVELEAAIGRGTLEEIDGWAAEAATAAAVGAALSAIFDGDDNAFPLVAYTGSRWTLREDVESYNARVTDAEQKIAEERKAEERRIQEEQERLEREERERKER